jgi:hypothetical protein
MVKREKENDNPELQMMSQRFMPVILLYVMSVELSYLPH